MPPASTFSLAFMRSYRHVAILAEAASRPVRRTTTPPILRVGEDTKYLAFHEAVCPTKVKMNNGHYCPRNHKKGRQRHCGASVSRLMSVVHLPRRASQISAVTRPTSPMPVFNPSVPEFAKAVNIIVEGIKNIWQAALTSLSIVPSYLKTTKDC